MPNQKISALVITYNEMGYIQKCIDSIEFVDEIIVVDSYSTDGTYEYLLNHPKVRVIQNPFKNFTAQKSFALKQASNDWVLFLDADEVVPEQLEKEITQVVNCNPKHVAYWFYRTFMFQKERLRFSGWQTDKNYRLFRKSKVNFSDKRIVHETLDIDGTSGILKSKLIHYCYKDYENYKGKMLYYGQLKAKEAFNNHKQFNYALLILKPLWKFLYSYIVRLGFLDGAKGITICQLNALGDLERYRELQKLKQEETWSSIFKTYP
ncbi:MAG: glycosyl transferase [Flavobacteriaceae bacterium]|nr:MAG: glycosyl transferase [Flavobacteriaceae bacterium]